MEEVKTERILEVTYERKRKETKEKGQSPSEAVLHEEPQVCLPFTKSAQELLYSAQSNEILLHLLNMFLFLKKNLTPYGYISQGRLLCCSNNHKISRNISLLTHTPCPLQAAGGSFPNNPHPGAKISQVAMAAGTGCGETCIGS